MNPTPPAVLLDHADDDGSDLLLFERPREIIQVGLGQKISEAFDRLEQARAAGFHLAGWFAYELGYLIQPRQRPLYEHNFRLGLPLLWFGVFDPPRKLARTSLRARGRVYAGPLSRQWSAKEYRSSFTRVQRYIRDGDIYQANLTFHSYFYFVGDPFALWLGLRDEAAVRHGAYIDMGKRQILSLSPELHFSVGADREMECRPMKGTAPRGYDPQSDEERRRALRASLKDRAENLMIVDLMRNDMGRIAEIGSVHVPELFRIETYPSLHTMISVVKAQLRRDVGIAELIKAIFPCGSVTGAPKIRAMQIIRAEESSPRGVYCGSIGHFAPDGSASFNVAIRTIMIEGGRGFLGIGGGVVQDSTAASEYAECLLKAKFFELNRKPLRLIETLRYSSGSFVDLERHLARLASSEREFCSLRFNGNTVRDTLEAAVKGRDGDLRVRLMLNESGRFTARAEPLAPPWDRGRPAPQPERTGRPRSQENLDCIVPDSGPASGSIRWSFAISPERVDSSDVLLRHKTDWRELFERESARVARDGIDEVVFLNERGELTEGSRTNLFIRRNDRLVTPPLASGLLNGILRSKLLESGECAEEILYPRDLETADAIFLGNALRGLIPAVMVGRDSIPDIHEIVLSFPRKREPSS
ncbi:MAG TPA: aminodeoxychorismate synthase component I [Rhizomicrobium sp.]|nr:aminodeoxychorismate synthase component I [Rhizomicrobium sp.]